MAGKSKGRNTALKAERKNIKQQQKRKIKKRNIIIGICAGILLAVLIISTVAAINVLNPVKKVADRWKPYVAVVTETGEKADLTDIYNNRYTTYSGRLYLYADRTFEYWIELGNDDGTHTGTYEVDVDKCEISLSYDSGDTEVITFTIGDDGNADEITAIYGEYTLKFYRETDEYFASEDEINY